MAQSQIYDITGIRETWRDETGVPCWMATGCSAGTGRAEEEEGCVNGRLKCMELNLAMSVEAISNLKIFKICTGNTERPNLYFSIYA